MWLYVYWCWDGDKHVISIQDWYCKRSAQRWMDLNRSLSKVDQICARLIPRCPFLTASVNRRAGEVLLLSQPIPDLVRGNKFGCRHPLPCSFSERNQSFEATDQIGLSEDPPKPYIYNIIFRVNIDTTHFPQTHNVYMYIHIHIAIYTHNGHICTYIYMEIYYVLKFRSPTFWGFLSGNLT